MTQPQAKHILLPIPVAQALVKYLEQRPYSEVHQLMRALTEAPAAMIQPQPEPKPQLVETP